MKLYVTPTSPYARIVQIVILEKGLEGRVETFVAETRIPGSPYYSINPSGRVPYLLCDDGVGLEDSALICAYLDHLNGEPAFEPAERDAWEYRRLDALARSMLDGLAVWARELRRPEHERSPTIVAHEARRSERMADRWETEVENPVMGDPLTLPQITLMAALELEARIPGFQWRSGRPRLRAWADARASRPSIAATRPRSGV